MAVYFISLGGLPPSPEQSREWCARLEEGGILYFPETPVPVPADDLEFLLSRRQTGSKLHKNIAYKPARDRLSGLGREASDTEEAGRLRNSGSPHGRESRLKRRIRWA